MFVRNLKSTYYEFFSFVSERRVVPIPFKHSKHQGEKNVLFLKIYSLNRKPGGKNQKASVLAAAPFTFHGRLSSSSSSSSPPSSSSSNGFKLPIVGSMANTSSVNCCPQRHESRRYFACRFSILFGRLEGRKGRSVRRLAKRRYGPEYAAHRVARQKNGKSTPHR